MLLLVLKVLKLFKSSEGSNLECFDSWVLLFTELYIIKSFFISGVLQLNIFFSRNSLSIFFFGIFLTLLL